MRSACSPAARRTTAPQRARRWTRRAPPTRALQAAPRRAAQGRAAADGDRQPGAWCAPAEADALAAAVQTLGIPVYLSGMARGLLGPRPPAADAPPAPQGAARGRLRAAGRRALRLPARLRQARAPQRHADRRQPQRQGRAAEPPARRGGHRRRRAVHRRRWRRPLPARRRALGRLVRHAAPARRRARGRDRRSRPRRAASTSTRWRSSARWRPRPATTPIFVADGGDFVATAQLRAAPARAAELARPGRLRHAGRGRGLRARRGAGAARQRGLDRLGRRRLRLRPGRVRHASCARASRSSPWWATTPAGRRSRASR